MPSILSSIASINASTYASTPLTQSVGTSDTTMSITSTSTFPSGAPFVVLVDSEAMLVTAVQSATSLKVVRGYAGTTVAAHSNGATVYGLVNQDTTLYDLRSFGAAPGTTDATAALSAAITALGANLGTIVIAGGTFSISPTPPTVLPTVPANVTLYFAEGGQLVVAASQTLEICGPIVAPPTQIFQGNGAGTTGTVMINPERTPEIWVDWFGADSTGTQDSTLAIQAAVSAYTPSTIPGSPPPYPSPAIRFCAGAYRISDTNGVLTISGAAGCYGVRLLGTGGSPMGQLAGTTLIWTGTSSYPLLMVKAPGTVVKGFSFAVANNHTALAGIDFEDDSSGILTQKCSVEDCCFLAGSSYAPSSYQGTMTHGIVINNSNATSQLDTLRIIRCWFGGMAGWGIDLAHSPQGNCLLNIFEHCYFDGCGAGGVNWPGGGLTARSCGFYHLSGPCFALGLGLEGVDIIDSDQETCLQFLQVSGLYNANTPVRISGGRFSLNVTPGGSGSSLPVPATGQEFFYHGAGGPLLLENIACTGFDPNFKIKVEGSSGSRAHLVIVTSVLANDNPIAANAISAGQLTMIGDKYVNANGFVLEFPNAYGVAMNTWQPGMNTSHYDEVSVGANLGLALTPARPSIAAAQASVAPNAGGIPNAAACLYAWTYTDVTGTESAAGPTVEILAGATATVPAAPLVMAGSVGGQLTVGTAYQYAVTNVYFTATGNSEGRLVRSPRPSSLPAAAA